MAREEHKDGAMSLQQQGQNDEELKCEPANGHEPNDAGDPHMHQLQPHPQLEQQPPRDQHNPEPANGVQGANNGNQHDIDQTEITDKMVQNVGQMSILWTFVLCQAVFGSLKYGPFFASDNCAIITPDFDESCNVYYLYPVQCGAYVILFIAFWICTPKRAEYAAYSSFALLGNEPVPNDLRAVILHRAQRWDQLKFPLCVLAGLCLSEVVFAIFAPHIDRWWYLWQLGIDFFGYLLWFIYSSVAGKLGQLFCKCSQIKLNKNVMLLHILFIFIASFGIFYLLITMFAQDFEFDLSKLSNFAFVQIIIESVLIIEWAHVVIESGIHHQYEQEEDKKKLLRRRADILANPWLILAFLCNITAGVVFGFMKYFVSPCSNFDFRFFFDAKSKDCHSWMWFGQCGMNIAAFLFLFTGFFCFENGEQLILMEWNRLYFPFLLWIILLFLECLVMYIVNTHYWIQVLTDFCAYILFFVQALYVVQFRKYKRALSEEDKCFALLSVEVEHVEHHQKFPNHSCCGICNCDICTTTNYKLMICYFIFAVYPIIFAIKIIANFVMDVSSVRSAAEYLSDVYSKDAATVETLAFIQIIFENTLLMEYIHVCIGPLA